MGVAPIFNNAGFYDRHNRRSAGRDDVGVVVGVWVGVLLLLLGAVVGVWVGMLLLLLFCWVGNECELAIMGVCYAP